jgi:hypothetical protein
VLHDDVRVQFEQTASGVEGSIHDRYEVLGRTGLGKLDLADVLRREADPISESFQRQALPRASAANLKAESMRAGGVRVDRFGRPPTRRHERELNRA